MTTDQDIIDQVRALLHNAPVIGISSPYRVEVPAGRLTESLEQKLLALTNVTQVGVNRHNGVSVRAET